MADFSINLGDIFLLDTRVEKYHWYIVIAHLNENRFIFVNISTWHENGDENDGACILRPSERMPQFIRHKSFLFYRHARDYTADELEKLIAPDSEIPYDKLDPQILKRVQKESSNAENLKIKYRKAVMAHMKLP